VKDIAYATRGEAEARSRAEWEKVLGRPKRPEDVTEFLWSVAENEDRTAVVRVPAKDEARLTLAERQRLRSPQAVDRPEIGLDEQETLIRPGSPRG